MGQSKMKVFFACLFAFSAAQAPTKEQTCQDCKAFNNLIKDEAEGPNNNIIKAFLNQINIACNETSSQPPLCQLSLDSGFMNWWNEASSPSTTVTLVPLLLMIFPRS